MTGTRVKASKRVIVIGGGVGGLSAAIDLAGSGVDVTVLERHSAPGGKMREVQVAGRAIDTGPTVFTMRGVFASLFEDAGLSLDDYVTLAPVATLARHSWADGSRLDLFPDVERSAQAIAEFANAAEAEAYRRFAADSERIFDTLDLSFMRAEKPGPLRLTLSLGLSGISRLIEARPFTSLWNELGKRFRDPRLQQLFGRYATYCGSSPFSAPATLMLIAHAERAGVWQVKGGMQRLAEGLAKAAIDSGATVRYSASVQLILTEQGRVTGVKLDDGERLPADAIIYNGDSSALASGLLGAGSRKAVPHRTRGSRSLSAVTWALVARTKGFALEHHNVLFGADYKDEFSAIFERQEICQDPTIYLCAQDRGGDGGIEDDAERLFLLINAPPRELAEDVIEGLGAGVIAALSKHGLELANPEGAPVVTTPGQFAERFPGSGGAIYGWPTHGWNGSFARFGTTTRVQGLYLAGGTVHPGPGVPMTALSGRLAAERVRSDR